MTYILRDLGLHAGIEIEIDSSLLFGGFRLKCLTMAARCIHTQSTGIHSFTIRHSQLVKLDVLDYNEKNIQLHCEKYISIRQV